MIWIFYVAVLENDCSKTDDDKKCLFPFRYNGKNYEECTTEDDPEDPPWCATSLRVKDYGNCSAECADNGNHDTHPVFSLRFIYISL